MHVCARARVLVMHCLFACVRIYAYFTCSIFQHLFKNKTKMKKKTPILLGCYYRPHSNFFLNHKFLFSTASVVVAVVASNEIENKTAMFCECKNLNNRHSISWGIFLLLLLLLRSRWKRENKNMTIAMQHKQSIFGSRAEAKLTTTTNGACTIRNISESRESFKDKTKGKTSNITMKQPGDGEEERVFC